MSTAASRTGVGPTVTVAVEQRVPEPRRLITDALAPSMLPLGMRLFVFLTRASAVRDWVIRSLEREAPGLWAGVMLRKRLIDDALITAAPHVDAVVNLGAGFDTRLYRFPELRGLPAWELDLPGNIARKRDRLRAALGGVPENVRLVPTDFDRQDTSRALADHGYDAGVPTFFVLEAVTQYLTPEGIEATFELLGRAPRGSRLAFTYVLREFIEGRNLHGQEALHRTWVVKRGAWLWGLDPDEVDPFLRRYGWRLVEDLDGAALARRYHPDPDRRLASTPIEHAAYAEKT